MIFFLTKTIEDEFTEKRETDIFTEQYNIKDTIFDIIRNITNYKNNLIRYNFISIDKIKLFFISSTIIFVKSLDPFHGLSMLTYYYICV